jgi:hypothetical protein
MGASNSKAFRAQADRVIINKLYSDEPELMKLHDLYEAMHPPGWWDRALMLHIADKTVSLYDRSPALFQINTVSVRGGTNTREVGYT